MASNFTPHGTNFIEDVSTLTALERWQMVTIDWPRYPDSGLIRCGKCDQCIYRTHDDKGNKYLLDDADILALFVAHLRQRHEDTGKGFI
jgi:hypothetical protein